MDIKELLEELESTKTYKEFKEKHPNAFFTAGFFIFATDEKEQDKIQLDFYIPELKKFSSFEYPFNSHKTHDDIIEHANPFESLEFTIDLSTIREFLDKELKKVYPKLICILQNNEWNVTGLDGMDVRRIKIDAITGNIKESGSMNLQDIVKFEKK